MAYPSKRKIKKILRECQAKVEEMRGPLLELELADVFQELEENNRLEILEQENKYHGTWDWEYDLDPNEL